MDPFMTLSHLHDAPWLCPLPATPLDPSHLHRSSSSSQPIFLNFLPAFFCLLMTWWVTLGLPIREWIKNCLQELGQLTSNYTTEENIFSLPQYPLTVYKSSGSGVSWAPSPSMTGCWQAQSYILSSPLCWLSFVLFCFVNTNKDHLEKTTSIEKMLSSDQLVSQSAVHFLD